MTGLKKITLPVRNDGLGDNVFAHAAALARRHQAHVEVLHCKPQVDDLMGYGVVIPKIVRAQIEAAVAQNAGAEEAQLREEFRALARDLGLKEGPPESGVATANFIDYAGKQADAVRHYGRLADMVCVPQPVKSRKLGHNTLKSALYTSARPVMMCPPREDRIDDLGVHIAVGWNGSLEATRAVAMGLPVMARAETVTVLTTGPELNGATVEDLAQYLSLHGVAVTIARFEGGGSIGQSLLREAQAAGADMMVMGAYHESYERETLLGGNTQAVVDAAAFPVAFAH